ncbi:hypothetical protein VTG60DRAFT_929 [Thermothelomyces hinnuleus]
MEKDRRKLEFASALGRSLDSRLSRLGTGHGARGGSLPRRSWHGYVRPRYTPCPSSARIIRSTECVSACVLRRPPANAHAHPPLPSHKPQFCPRMAPIWRAVRSCTLRGYPTRRDGPREAMELCPLSLSQPCGAGTRYFGRNCMWQCGMRVKP